MALESLGGVLAGNPTGIGAQAIGRPAAVSADGQTLDVFAIGLGDNMLWRFFQLPNAAWILEPHTGNLPAGAVSAVSRGPGLIDVFALGADTTLRHWSRSGATWQDNIDRGGSMPAGGPCAAVSPAGNVDVFAVASGGLLMHWSWDGIVFTPGVPVPSASLLPGVPAAAWTSSKLNAFAIDGNRAMMYYSQATPGGVWQTRNLGGNMSTSGVAAVGSGTRLDVFGIDRDGQLHVWNSMDEGVTWTESPLGGSLNGGLPAAVSPSTGRIDVFAVGDDTALWHWRFQGGAWSSPNSLGGNLPAEGVAAAARSGDRVDAFVVGSDAKLQHWPGPGEGRFENWVNWAGNISFQPLAVLHPTSVEEIVTIVQTAEMKGLHVRACGSHWSFTDVVATDDYVIETRQLNARIDVVLNNALNKNGAAMRTATMDLFHVEAGITVHDLCLRLDALTPPMALITQGNSGGQTLGGVVSTAVHGGDFFLPPICESVQAIHLIGPGGTQYWIERGNTKSITSAGKLRKLFPDLQVKQDDDWFNAVLVSIGSMGIIYSLVIAVRSQFGLAQFTRTDIWSMVKPMLRGAGGALGSITKQRDPFVLMTPTRPPAPPTYLEVVINPSHADPPCWVTTRTVVPVPVAPAPSPTWLLYAAGAIPPLMFPSLISELLGAVAAIPGLVVLLPLLATAIGGFALAGGNIGQLISGVVNFATTHGAPQILGALEDVLINNSRKPGSTQGKGFQIMDGYDGDESFTAYRAMSMELAFDGSKKGFIDFVDECIGIVQTSMDVGGVPFGGMLSLRFCAKSDAYLAFERFPLNCIIEIACFKDLVGNLEVLHRMEEAMYRHNGIQHWGQYHRLSNSDGYVSKHYPKLKDWRRVQQEISMGSRTFENSFTWRCGLST
jgi:hypothetical protein